MTNGAHRHDDGPATFGQILVLNLVTASYPTIFLFVAYFTRSPHLAFGNDVLYSLQEIGADSAIVLIGIAFYLAAAGDLAVISQSRPKRWQLIVMLIVSAGMVLLLTFTTGNQIRAGLQQKLFLIQWTTIQAGSTMLALIHGAILKAASQDAAR